MLGAGVDPAQERDDEAVARIRERLQRDAGSERSWFDRLTPEARRDLADLGRRMVHLLEGYVAPEAEDLPALEQAAAEIGGR